MSNLPILRQQWINPATGLGYAGAKLYTYAPGTTTNKAVYTTVARNVAHANPVVADANGLFAEIYCTNDTTYRFILKDSSDNTIFDVDNIAPASLDGTLSTYVYETNENPNHYGADGNRADDETNEVQSAINAAVANTRTGTVDLMGRIYRCDSALSIPSGVTIQNGTLDFSACNADECMLARGTLSGQVLLASDAASGVTSLTLANTSLGLSINSTILVQQGSGADVGEIAKVASVSGVTVTLAEPLRGSYTVAGGGGVKKMTPVTDVTLKDLVLEGNASSSGDGHIVYFDLCENPIIENCTAKNTKSTASPVVFSCTRNGTARNMQSRSVGVGVAVINASIFTNLDDVTVDICSTGFEVGTNGDSRGLVYETTIEKSSANATNYAASVTKYASNTKFLLCDLFSKDYYFYDVGNGTFVDACKITCGAGSTIAYYFSTSGLSPGTSMKGPKIKSSRILSLTTGGTGACVSMALTNGVSVYDVSVVDCSLDGTVTGSGVSLSGSGTGEFIGLVLNGNSSLGKILCAAGTYSRAVIFGNSVKASNTPLIIGNITGGIVDGNVLDGNSLASDCLYISACTRIAVSGNTFMNATDGIDVSTTTFSDVSIGQNFYYSITNKTKVDAANDCFLQVTNLTATEIVGTSSGDIGHANGATIITAPGAGLIAVPVAIVVDFTYATGQYGDGGGNLRAVYAGGSPCTSTVSTLTTVGAAASNISVLHPIAGLALANTAIGLNASAAMSAGAGAGTAQVRAYYKILEG